MNKLFIFIGTMLGSWIGWWIGEHAGIMTAFLLSSVGSLAGVYFGWRIWRDYFSEI
jgi:predicted MFS family arabinose efflux permease